MAGVQMIVDLLDSKELSYDEFVTTIGQQGHQGFR